MSDGFRNYDEFFEALRHIGVDASILRTIVQGGPNAVARLEDGRRIQSIAATVDDARRRVDSFFAGADAERQTLQGYIAEAQRIVDEAKRHREAARAAQSDAHAARDASRAARDQAEQYALAADGAHPYASYAGAEAARSGGMLSDGAIVRVIVDETRDDQRNVVYQVKSAALVFVDALDDLPVSIAGLSLAIARLTRNSAHYYDQIAAIEKRLNRLEA